MTRLKNKKNNNKLFFFSFPNAVTLLCFLVVLAVLLLTAPLVFGSGRPSLRTFTLPFPPFIPSFACCFSLSVLCGRSSGSGPP